jgi:histone-arginine methyltransferase CARM1
VVTPHPCLDSSAEYFRYYGLISQQENMLRDDVRTGTYRAAMSERSRAAFAGKIVVDVGCGSGVLSFFAASAGARRVYAIEASEMAAHAAALVDADPRAREVVRVVRGRAEDFADFEALARAAGDDPDHPLIGVSSTSGGPGRKTGKQQHQRQRRLGGADVIVSEPMGTALFNERMVETFVRARDAFGRRDAEGVPVPEMFPRLGRLHAAPFADDALWAEMDAKGAFWAEGKDAHGIDVTPLAVAARRAYFRQCVIDAFAPGILRADRPCSFEWDFARLKPEALEAIEMPLRFEGVRGGVAHGVALWFDVEFATAAEKTAEARTGKSTSRFLSTAPGLPTTHWYQMRLVFETPLAIDPAGEAGATVRGNLRLTARDDRSYDAEATLETEGGGERETARGTWDLKDPYYRQTLFPQPGYTKAQTARWYGTET